MATRGKLTETELAYMAGVVDSDGCITVLKMKPQGCMSAPRYVLTITIVNTSHDLMEWLIERFGGFAKARKRAQVHHKLTYAWSYANSKAADVLRVIRPYLVIKGRQADVGIELIENWETGRKGRGTKTSAKEVSRREMLTMKIRELNRFGDTAATTKSLGPLAGDAIV
jgi:hypothetical protein